MIQFIKQEKMSYKTKYEFAVVIFISLIKYKLYKVICLRLIFIQEV